MLSSQCQNSEGASHEGVNKLLLSGVRDAVEALDASIQRRLLGLAPGVQLPKFHWANVSGDTPSSAKNGSGEASPFSHVILTSIIWVMTLIDGIRQASA